MGCVRVVLAVGIALALAACSMGGGGPGGGGDASALTGIWTGIDEDEKLLVTLHLEGSGRTVRGGSVIDYLRDDSCYTLGPRTAETVSGTYNQQTLSLEAEAGSFTFTLTANVDRETMTGTARFMGSTISPPIDYTTDITLERFSGEFIIPWPFLRCD